MSDSLNAFSLAIGLLASDPTVNPGEWRDYVWTAQPIGTCLQDGRCPVTRTRWDWKRDQRVEIRIAPGSKGITVTNRLINNDPSDDDDVCVTVLFRDKAGKSITVFHENRHAFPRTDTATTSVVRKAALKSITSIAVGTKQCRRGAHEDDDVYRRAQKRTR